VKSTRKDIVYYNDQFFKLQTTLYITSTHFDTM